MQLLRSSDYKRMPWKNGGGETTEVTVSPAGAGLDAFDWRISMALVKGDGPFSSFSGIDRTLAILDGAGMRLDIAGARHDLTRASAPLAFPADVPTDAVLMDGAITDLNVMSRREAFRHKVERFELGAAATFTADADVVAVLADTGRITVTAPETVALGPRDTVIFDAPRAVAVVAKEAARGYIISFWKIA